ncbi:MAG TPA: type II secretion system F family protein [Candidatus Hydrogenedentes bacterium]|nr:type II secretion system F family protein [Candidatus Hydrogenedentota bacterium]HPG65758.1 type II secretion system F family protein [Candidatus Hydrogenedentota bacterium]
MNWRKLMATDLAAFLLRREQPHGGEFWPTFTRKKSRELATPKLPGSGLLWFGVAMRPKRRYREVLTLTRQLGALVHANVDLVVGLEALSAEAPTHRLRTAGRDIAKRLAAGESLADAIEAQRRFFPKICCDVIRAGENTGALEASFDDVEGLMTDILTIPRALQGWLAYLVATGIIQIAIAVFLLVRVIPVLVEICREFGVPPSPKFSLLINASDVLAHYWAAFLIGAVVVIAAIVALTRILKHSPFASKALGRTVVRIPVIRTLLVKRDLALAALIIEKSAEAGIPMTDTLRSAARIDVNPLYARLLERLAERVEGGMSLANALEREPRHLVPRSFCIAAAMGEQSGLLPQALGRIGQHYRREALKVQHVLLAVTQPVGIVFPIAFVFILTTGWFETYTILIEALLAQI